MTPSSELKNVTRLSNSELVLDCTPAKGCDITQISDRKTGATVLWTTPWTTPSAPHVRAGDSDAESWLFHYPGGWQLLVPNAGGGGTHQGIHHRFHGEASIVPWESSTGDQTLSASVSLFDSPLTINRQIALDGRTVRVEETIHNTGQAPVEYIWSHHPGFGGTLLGGPTTISTNAQTVEADAAYNPEGNRLRPGAHGHWPLIDGTEAPIDLRSPLNGGSCLAYLSDFPSIASASVMRTDGSLGVEIRWPSRSFPFAWLWQELGGSTDSPWFGRGRVIGIEPSTSMPATGIEEVAKTTGTQRCLDPNATVSAWVELEILSHA